MKKAIIATISIVLILTVVAVGVTAYASNGYTLPVSEWGDRLGIDSDKQPDEQEKPDDTTPGGEIPGGDTQTPGEEIPGDSTDNPGTVVVSPMEINLNWEDFVFSSDYIPTEEYIPQYRQEFKAEILPENTIDKTLIWSAEFVNPTSEWAVGKNVSDYIKLTTEEDTLSAEIECLQPFGEQIIVTVASKRNNKVKDTCLLDFKQFATEYYIEYDGVKVEFQDDTAGMFSADFVCDPDVKGPEHTISIHYALSDTYTIPRQPEFGINGTMYHSQGYSFGVDDSAFRNGETTLTFTTDRGLLETSGGSSVDNKTTEEIHDIVESIGTGILNIWNTLSIPDIRLKIDLNPVSAVSNMWREPEEVFVLFGQSIDGLTDTGKTFKTIYIPEEINGQAVTNINLSYLDNLETLYIPSQAKGTLSCCGDPKLTTVIIGDNSGLTGTGMGGFYDSENLSVLELGENSIFTEIYDNSFTRTKLQKIELPDSVNIGRTAFQNCEALKTVIIGENATIGENAFSGCSSLESITMGDNVTLATSCFSGADKITQVIIPDGTTSIPGYAFNSCDLLTTVTIPVSVTDIYYCAFRSCPISTINYLGTKEQWNAINKIDGWDESVGDYTVVCTDGNIIPGEEEPEVPGVPDDPVEIVPQSIKIGELSENTVELQAYVYYKFLIGEGENPMPDYVTVIYSDESTRKLPASWKNQEGETVTAQNYVGNWYVTAEEHTSDENFIVVEVVDGDETYTFPMNVKIYPSTIVSMQFYVDGTWRDSVTSETVTTTVRLTFNDENESVLELPTVIRPSMTGYGYAYIGYDVATYDTTAALIEFEGCNLKQAKRIRIEG